MISDLWAKKLPDSEMMHFNGYQIWWKKVIYFVFTVNRYWLPIFGANFYGLLISSLSFTDYWFMGLTFTD